MNVEDRRIVLDRFRRATGMYTLGSSFYEVCALFTGYNTAVGGTFLHGFHPWLVLRTGTDRPELAWPMLVLHSAFAPGSVLIHDLTPEQDGIAANTLFSLLGDYFDETASLGQLQPDTLAVHAGRGERVVGGPLNPPIVPASNFFVDGYAREQGSPGWAPFEEAIGQLEGGEAVAFSSGLAATAAMFDTLPMGARVVGPAAGYAWTRSLLKERADEGRLNLVEVDTSDTEATLAAVREADTALLWLESPSNPLCEVAELDVLCAEAGVPVAVDSTFATPLLQQPLKLGAAVSMQSATKFIGGHSDLLLGVLTTSDPERAEAFRHRRGQHGATPGALEAFLALRGLRTLPARLQISQRSAETIATRLNEHPAVQAVHFPGIGHPERAQKFMRGFGAMLSFEVKDAAAADAICANVKVITHAKSLGGVETLIERRARFSGSSAPPGLLRVSVGCEHVEDLWRDLEQALRL